MMARTPRLTECVYCGYREARADTCGWCRRERRVFVYFMEQRDGRAIKIGYSATPNSRLNGLVTGNPYGIRLLGFVEGWGREEESQLHAMFANHNIEREWFHPHEDIYAYIGSLTERGIFERPAPQMDREPTVVPF